MRAGFQGTNHLVGPALHAAAAASLGVLLLAPVGDTWDNPVRLIVSVVVVAVVAFILFCLPPVMRFANRTVDRIAAAMPMRPVIRARLYVRMSWLIVIVVTGLAALLLFAMKLTRMEHAREQFVVAGGTQTVHDVDGQSYVAITFPPGESRLSPVVFEYIATRFPAIHLLDLDTTNVSDSMLSHLRGCEVAELSISGCLGLSDAGLRSLIGIDVTSLNLDFSPWLTNAGIEYISQIPSLERISFRKCSNITHLGLQALDRLPRLRALHLEDCQGVDDAAIETLCRLRLEELDVRGVRIDDAQLKQLAQIATLKTLRLRGASITDEGLLGLAHCVAPLRSLELVQCPNFTATGLAALNAAKLESLDASRCPQLTNEALRGLLGDASTIRQLSINDCDSITDDVIPLLLQHPFEVIRAQGCDGLSEEGRARLAAHPTAEVHTSLGEVDEASSSRSATTFRP